MTVKKAHKKPSTKQAPLFGQQQEQPKVELANAESSLSPIADKKSYDQFLKIIALRIYRDFEKTMKEANVEKPELILVGFDLKKTTEESDVKMGNYIAMNARLIMENAFVDRNDFASKYMPRVMRQMAEEGASDFTEFMESKVQHDLMMEIRSIAMQHIPEADRYGYRHKLKVL
jgi:hypothetical protein